MLCEHLRMPDEDEDLYTHRDGHWRVLPRWVKWASVLIGLPAWLVFMAGIFRGDIGSSYQIFAFALFGCVAALQGFFIAQAYWRMDL
jgi:hypothetical protein